MLGAGFLAIGRFLLEPAGTGTDQQTHTIAGTLGPWATMMADGVSAATEWGLTVVVGLGLIGFSWWRARRPDLPVLTAVTITGAMALCWALKYLVDRPRPAGATGVSSPAFPSAHATRAMVLALLVTWLLLVLGRRWWRYLTTLVLLAGAVVVGTARVVLGVHWPTDVLAGWALAALWSGAVWLILRPAPDGPRTSACQRPVSRWGP